MAKQDGRSLRRQRNYDGAVDAILDLLNEGHARPTAQQVAERSGLSIRSIFRLFEEVESLHAAAIARKTERVLPLLEQLPTDKVLADRIEALVENRARFYEVVAPVRRFAVGLAGTSPAITSGLARSRRFFRAQLEDVFASELRMADPAEATGLADALDAATSWELWDLLRSTQKLSFAAAKAVVRRLVEGTLTTQGVSP